MSNVVQIQKLNSRHQAMINWLLTHPRGTRDECARDFGYTPTYVSMLINSDMFQAVLQERSKQLGIVCVHSIKSRVTGIQMKILDKIEERVDNDRVSEKFLRETSEQMFRAMGVLDNKASNDKPAEEKPAVQVNVQINSLERARDKLVRGDTVEAA